MSSGVDPIIGVAQILAVFVGAATAAAIAPHLVVLIAGIAGGTIGLMSWRKCTILGGIGYVISMGALAWLLAGSTAELLTSLWPSLEDKRLVTPVALGIGIVGHRWPIVVRWAGGLFKAAIEAGLRGTGK